MVLAGSKATFTAGLGGTGGWGRVREAPEVIGAVVLGDALAGGAEAEFGVAGAVSLGGVEADAPGAEGS